MEKQLQRRQHLQIVGVVRCGYVTSSGKNDRAWYSVSHDTRRDQKSESHGLPGIDQNEVSCLQLQNLHPLKRG